MSIPPELDLYLRSAGPIKVIEQYSESRLRFQSQVWHGIPWTHDLVVVGDVAKSRTAMLYVTGGPSNPFDEETMLVLSQSSGVPVVGLFDIPNQPLLNNLSEDDLIAQTLVLCLESGDGSWPLLFPMVHAVKAAMVILEDRFDEWIITGASKRGWTTWLAGCTGDSRIVGIVPMVFDNLNAAAQIQSQLSAWGRPSAMIDPYVSRGLTDALKTEAGLRLANMVDPYAYLDQLRCPLLMINGANDPYWTVDALGNYWHNLRKEKAVWVVPNGGHGVADAATASPTIGAFVQSLVQFKAFPHIDWDETETEVVVTSDHVPLNSKLWHADEPSGTSERVWVVQESCPGLLPNWTKPLGACLLELEFEPGFTLSTQAFRRLH